MKYSVNDFNKAMTSLDTSVVEQNRAVEQMNYDVVDIVNQVIAADEPSATITRIPLNTPQDIAFVMAQVAARMRILLAKRRQ
jgi:hypothetical protein